MLISGKKPQEKRHKSNSDSEQEEQASNEKDSLQMKSKNRNKRAIPPKGNYSLTTFKSNTVSRTSLYLFISGKSNIKKHPQAKIKMSFNKNEKKPLSSLVNSSGTTVKQNTKFSIKCQFCDMVFLLHNEYIQHCNKNHDGHKFKCNHCGKGFLRKHNLQGHQDDCGKTVEDPSEESEGEGIFVDHLLKVTLK